MNLTKPMIILLAIGMVVASFLLGYIAPVHAAEPQKNPPVYITEKNPERDVGYHVGDVLHRTVTLKVEKPYKLLQTSLPLTGTEKKYRGQDQGIEVHSAKLTESEQGNLNVYQLELSYQVFTSSIVAKPSHLPPEFVKFGGNGRVFQVRIPSWPFRISPLAVYGSVKIEEDMSPLRGPLLLDATPYRHLLWGLIAVLAITAIGLLYILGNRAWLPRMGGPFAHASRDLRKIKRHAGNDTDGLKIALSRMHQAFNSSSQGSIFTAEGFLASHPGFLPIKDDIQRFFILSRFAFFDAEANHGISGDQFAWLQTFCRRCRDCERGLA